MQKQTGFTLIELIIVIAIIAILVAVVMLNVPQYIAKGKNSAITGDMLSILVSSASWNDNHYTYIGFSADTTFSTPKNQIVSYLPSGGNTIVEIETADAFCACTPLLDVAGSIGQTFCVDSNLNKKQTGTTCAAECSAAGICQ